MWDDVATKLSVLNKNRPEGSVEVSLIRMNTVRNDVAHFQVCPHLRNMRFVHTCCIEVMCGALCSSSYPYLRC